MITENGNLHLEIQTSRKNPVGVLRTTFRENGKIKHQQHGRITGCSLKQLKMLQLAFREKVIPHDNPDAFIVQESREWGASYALLELAKQLDLPKVIYSRPEPWVKSAIAMIIGRIIYPGSKLSLCHQHNNSYLWELCGVNDLPEVDEHCYRVMDKILERQKKIQKALAIKHLHSNNLVLYDITSVYFEGSYKCSTIVKYGYNRDHKKGKEQVVVGLICNDEGCPVGVEVFAGNTKDETTVLDKIREAKQEHGLDQVIFVGDRGMITKSNLEALTDEEDIKTISALTHGDIQKLLSRGVINVDLFDERLISEVYDPENPKQRYCLCRNKITAIKEKETRDNLLKLTIEGIKSIASYKNRTTIEKLGARMGKLLSKYKVEKFIKWFIEPGDQTLSNTHQVFWELDHEKIEKEKRLDGCYIISTAVDIDEMNTKKVVETYKKLSQVEKAFRTMKTTHLHVRPVFHKVDHRIRSHMFICMLSYYLQWNFCERLKPLFASDGEYENRRWTVRGVIECLAQLTRNKVSMEGAVFYRNSTPTEDQDKILKLLGVSM